ncbi:hypothetical protein ACQKWADRAFT_325615 [Trichoderma austrokoningii]
MSSNRHVSQNKFRDNAFIIQGDNNAPLTLEKDSSWIENISQTNPAYNKKRIFESKGPFLYESFRWILDHPDFNRWRNTKKSGVFWIKGDPGKGKTMLLGGLVDNFEANEYKYKRSLGYFFCQATDSKINTAAAIIGGLIFSFIKPRRKLQSHIYRTFKNELGKLNGPDRWYILCDMFEKITKHRRLPHPVCVVDALDECEQNGRKQLLKLIIETSCRVKWLVSSRNIPKIESELQAIDSSRRLNLELKENAEYVTQSVDLYINNSIQTITALQGDEELQFQAANTLKGKANGTFLWVALVIEQLRETKRRNVNKVLEDMPEGLENLYSLILHRLAKQEENDAYQVLLSTVTAAERPLRLEELHTFLSSEGNIEETTDDLRDVRDLDNTVYFIHQSVKDYMMGTASKIIFPSGIEYQHYTMFKTSLSAMSRTLKHDLYGIEDPGSNIEMFYPPTPDPLAPIAYCCVFWVDHLLQSCDSGSYRNKIFLKDDGILHSFLKSKYLCWLESLALLRSLEPQGEAAVQKLKNIFSGYYETESNKSQIDEMVNFRGRRGVSRIELLIHKAYQFIDRYQDLYIATYIDYAYTFFNHHDDSHLRIFIDDAYQFFHYNKRYVCKYPLQLYHSAIIFEDTHSAISTAFQQSMRAEFKESPIITKMPPTQLSLVQDIKLSCRGPIIALLYSPDSSLLCSLSHGGTMTLLRTNTCSIEHSIELGGGFESGKYPTFLPQHFLAFSSNSGHLISVSMKGVVHIWAVDCGTQVQEFSLNLNTTLVPGSEGLLGKCKVVQQRVIALSHHGDLAASTCRVLSGAMILVKIWMIKTGDCIFAIHRSEMPDVLHAAFSPNLEMIALIDETNARIYSVRTRQEIKHLSHLGYFVRENVKHSRFSSDSKVLALRYSNMAIGLWCTETWTMVHQKSSTKSAGHFDISPNATVYSLSCGNAVSIARIDTGERLLNTETHVPVYGPTFSPDWTDSSLLASFTIDTVQIWRACLNSGDEKSKLQKVRHASSILMDVVMLPKSKYVATRGDRDKIGIWNGESGECIQVLRGKTDWWHLPVFSPNSELVLCIQGNKGDVQVWHVGTGKPLHLLKGAGDRYETKIGAFSDDSRYIVVGCWTGRVKIWCVESGKCLYDNEGSDILAGISDVAFSPDSKYLATADENATVYIWDWRRGHCISRTKLECGPFLRKLAFSSDATVLVTISRSESRYDSYEANFYDISSGACLSHIDVGESKCLPVFDSAKYQVVSDRFKFYKQSSWKHWDIVPQPKYSYLETCGEVWIYFGEHKVFQIPRRFFATQISLSDNLLTFVTALQEFYIVQLPSQYIIKQ